MDLNKIFGLFSGGGEDHKINENLSEFKKSSYYKIGMFKKLIMNGLNFKKSVLGMFSSSLNDIDLKDVDLMGEFMMYHRGWYWLEQLDISDPEHIKDIKNSSDPDLLVALKLCINYFEEQEEYEKCAFLKKIQDFVEESLEV